MQNAPASRSSRPRRRTCSSGTICASGTSPTRTSPCRSRPGSRGPCPAGRGLGPGPALKEDRGAGRRAGRQDRRHLPPAGRVRPQDRDLRHRQGRDRDLEGQARPDPRDQGGDPRERRRLGPGADRADRGRAYPAGLRSRRRPETDSRTSSARARRWSRRTASSDRSERPRGRRFLKIWGGVSAAARPRGRARPARGGRTGAPPSSRSASRSWSWLALSWSRSRSP